MKGLKKSHSGKYKVRVQWKGIMFNVEGCCSYESGCLSGHPDNWEPPNSELIMDFITPEDESLSELIAHFQESISMDESFENAVDQALKDEVMSEEAEYYDRRDNVSPQK